MKHGKIINEKLYYAPKVLQTETQMISFPTDADYEANGYKPIYETETPVEEGYYFTPAYTDRGTYIEQSWERHENPEEPIDYEALTVRNAAVSDYNIMMGNLEDPEAE